MALFSWLFKDPAPAKKEPERKSQDTVASVKPLKKLARIEWNGASYPMEVVGESNYQEALISLCGSHNRHGYDLERIACLILEPSNPYDPNAVKVTIHGLLVGYLSRDQALRVGGLLKEQMLSMVECKAKIVGGWRTNQYDEGMFGVRLAVPNRGRISICKHN